MMSLKRSVQLVLILVLIGGGVFTLKQRQSRKTQRESVQRVTVTQGTIEETVEATGEVAPLNRVEIKPPIQGRIEQILIEEGDSVRAGQTVAWLSSNDRAAILDAARAKGPEEFKRWSDTYKPTPLVAPLSGIIILRNVVVGQTVDMSTILFALSDKLIVLAHVDEVDIGRVKTGMPARITLDSYPLDPIEGKVASVLYEGKNVSNVITYGVKITPLTIPPFFRSQMTANISLIVMQKKDVILLPRAALQESESGQKQVMIPKEGEKPILQSVETGIESGENIEIKSGLQPGDVVLVSRRRYTPQRNASQSPLIMGGSRQQQQGSGSTQRRRSQ